MSDISSTLLFALNIVVMEKIDDGLFKIIGNIPNWFLGFYPDAALQREALILGEEFPFLENFLIDVENFWAANCTGKIKSGVWSEVDLSGQESYFEASAIYLDNKKLLLISLGEFADNQEKQLLIQKGREINLNYQYLVKEIQKKEILIHCIVHDLSGQLTGINYCFELLKFQNLTPKGQEYIEIGKKQSTKLEMLIREILNAFSAEVESLDAFILDPAQAPDILTCVQEVIDALSPLFVANNMILQLNQNIDIAKNWKVVGEKSRLERILTNLIENAFRYSPRNSNVVVDIQDDAEFVLVSVDDQGTGVSSDISNNLFQKFAQGKDKSGKAGLGLYFCRITVERWGGMIGYINHSEGGCRFWFRLPKPSLI